MKYDRINKSDIFGFPLYYRIENRKGSWVWSEPNREPECESNDTLDTGVNVENPETETAERGIRPTLIISYREEINGVLHMLYEGQPISGNEIVKWLETNKSECPSLNDLPISVKHKFLDEFVGVSQVSDIHNKATKGQMATLLERREVNIERRKEFKMLTLGVLLSVDEERLDLSDSDKLVARELILKEGNRVWLEASPENFPWLLESAERKRRDVKRVMSKFFGLQNKAGIFGENPWANYDASAVRKSKLSEKACIKKYVEPTNLSRQQRSLVFKKCKDRLVVDKAEGLDIAVLLMITLGMDEHEISALNLEDFEYLDFFKNRLTVRITRRALKVEKRYKYTEISDPYERRKLPVISLAKECWEFVCKKNCIHSGETGQIHPLVPSKQNKNRRETPDKLLKAIEEYVSGIEGMNQRKVTDHEEITLPRISSMLKNTAKQKMLDVCVEDEEIRAILGKHPKRVSGKHYYDRFNDAAINKIGVLLDKWTGNDEKTAEPAEPVAMTHEFKAKRKHFKIPSSNAAHRVQAVINIVFSDEMIESFPEAGIELEIFSQGGMSGTLYFIKKQGGKNNGSKRKIQPASDTKHMAVLGGEQKTARQSA